MRVAGERHRVSRRLLLGCVHAIGLVLSVLLGAVGMVVTASAPAMACSCASDRLSSYVEGADVIVTGVLEDVEESGGGLFGGEGEATYRVGVESTFRGEATSDLVFTSAANSSSCGVGTLDLDRRYTFFLNRGPEGLSSSLCSGNQLASEDLERRLVALTGAPTAPLPSPEEERDRGWWLPATGAGLTVLAAAALLVWRRRTRP